MVLSGHLSEFMQIADEIAQHRTVDRAVVRNILASRKSLHHRAGRRLAEGRSEEHADSGIKVSQEQKGPEMDQTQVCFDEPARSSS